MKFNINRKVLADALSVVAPLAAQKFCTPVLNSVMIVVKGNKLKLETNNTQACVRRYVGIDDVDEDGRFLVNCADLNNYIQKLKCETIAFSIEGNTLTISHSRGKFELQTIPTDEFPETTLPTNNVTEITSSASTLCKFIEEGKNFVNNDELRPILRTIYAYIANGEFGICATNTHVLIHDKVNFSTDGNIQTEWTIEPVAFAPLVKSSKCAELVTITIADDKVSYRVDNTVIITMRTQGKYPDFKRIIPSEHKHEVSVDKDLIISSVSRVALACDDTRCIKLTLNDDTMDLSSVDFGTLKSSMETIPLSSKGGNGVIGLNANYLLTAMNGVDANEVILKFGDANRPFLFYSESAPNRIVLVMPMSLPDKINS